MQYQKRFSPKRPIPTALPGSLHAEYQRCGKPGCRCVRGQLHGPYWRRFWREGGRTRSEYIRLVDVPAVRQLCERYGQLHPSGRAFTRMLLEHTRISDQAITALGQLRAERSTS